MKYDKGMLLIDALLALLIVMILTNVSAVFINSYFHFNQMMLEEKVANEEEPGDDYY